VLGAEEAGRLLAKAVVSAEGEATVTIGSYRSGVSCDQRWYMAVATAASARRNVVLAAGAPGRPAC